MELRDVQNRVNVPLVRIYSASRTHAYVPQLNFGTHNLAVYILNKYKINNNNNNEII